MLIPESLRATAGLVSIILATVLPVNALHAVPPPVEQMSATCTAPTYASDHLVCADPELLNLDREMVNLLTQAKDAGINPPSELIEEQASWFRRRSMCAMQAEHKACLTAAYAERIEVLVGLTVAANGDSQRVKCAGSSQFSDVQIAPKANGSVLVFRNGQLIAVAIPATRVGNWAPFTSVRKQGHRTVLKSIAGLAAICVPAH